MQSEKPPRFNLKLLVVSLFALVLLYLGLNGRQEARLQIRVGDIITIRNRLQNQLELVRTPSILAGTNITHPNPGLQFAPQSKDLVNNLKARLEQFDADYARHKLKQNDSLEVRLGKAVIANVEGRFSDTLTLVTEEDERQTSQSVPNKNNLFFEILQVRGDAFFGRGEWKPALERYSQMVRFHTNPIYTIQKIGDCQLAIGSLGEALNTYTELAVRYRSQGNSMFLLGKPEASVGYYTSAIDLQKHLIDHHGRSDLASVLAINLRSRGNAYFAQRKMDAAFADMGNAIEIFNRLNEKDTISKAAEELAIAYEGRGSAYLFQGKLDLTVTDFNNAADILNRIIEKDGKSEVAKQLAMCRQNRGNAFLAQGKMDAAYADYEKAIETLNRLVSEKAEPETIHDLARAYNNRGVLYRAQGKLAMAIDDFQMAMKLITQSIEKDEQSNAAPLPSSSSEENQQSRRTEAKLEVSMGYSENAFEALLRTRFFEQRLARELHVAHAISAKNRGYAYLAQGKPELAITDFRIAVDIFARLVDQDGERDLALQFTKSLGAIAWMYATNPSDLIRNGKSALEYAIKACEQSEWRTYGPVETLAAAYAETANFAEAIKWQEKAFQLAPAKNKADARLRLELYKSGKPYRTPVS